MIFHFNFSLSLSYTLLFNLLLFLPGHQTVDDFRHVKYCTSCMNCCFWRFLKTRCGVCCLHYDMFSFLPIFNSHLWFGVVSIIICWKLNCSYSYLISIGIPSLDIYSFYIILMVGPLMNAPYFGWRRQYGTWCGTNTVTKSSFVHDSSPLTDTDSVAEEENEVRFSAHGIVDLEAVAEEFNDNYSYILDILNGVDDTPSTEDVAEGIVDLLQSSLLCEGVQNGSGEIVEDFVHAINTLLDRCDGQFPDDSVVEAYNNNIAIFVDEQLELRLIQQSPSDHRERLMEIQYAAQDEGKDVFLIFN